jgi:hypothetical protein
MTTYEEDIVDLWYNLQGYFTILNISFSAVKKRKGGKGRGEIDLLAIKVDDGKISNAVHIEVSVSVTTKFPEKSATNSGSDESGKIVKKFLSNDSRHKIKEFIGKIPYKRIFISSDFSKDVCDKLKQNIPRFGAKVISIKENNGQVNMTINYNNKKTDIEIIPFRHIFDETKKLIIQNGLINKNFQDTRYRALQAFIKYK